MLFKINRDVPANTTIANPDWQKLQVAKGTIVEWIVFCPVECADLMKFKVRYKGTQLLPFSRDEWMDALHGPIPIKENLILNVSPYVLDVYAYNLDDTYSHEYNIYVNIDPPTAVAPAEATAGFSQRWKNLFKGSG